VVLHRGVLFAVHKVPLISLLEEHSRYSPSYLVYFTHLARRTGVAIVMFI